MPCCSLLDTQTLSYHTCLLGNRRSFHAMVGFQPLQALLLLAKSKGAISRLSLQAPYGLVVEVTTDGALSVRLAEPLDDDTNDSELGVTKPGFRYSIEPDYQTTFIWYQMGSEGNPENETAVDEDDLRDATRRPGARRIVHGFRSTRRRFKRTNATSAVMESRFWMLTSGLHGSWRACCWEVGWHCSLASTVSSFRITRPKTSICSRRLVYQGRSRGSSVIKGEIEPSQRNFEQTKASWRVSNCIVQCCGVIGQKLGRAEHNEVCQVVQSWDDAQLGLNPRQHASTQPPTHFQRP